MGPCLEWNARKDAHGYGRLKVHRRETLAHRHVWEQAHGPTNLCVLHKCDNTSCIELTHLFLGTPKDNMQDKKAKGRSQARRSICKHGHLLDGITNKWSTLRQYRYTTRYCKTCNNRRKYK